MLNFKLNFIILFIYIVFVTFSTSSSLISDNLRTEIKFLRPEHKPDNGNVLLSSNNVRCQLPDYLLEEIQGYRPIAEQIIDKIINGNWKGVTYSELAKFTDKFGPRSTGSSNLEYSIDYMMEKMEGQNLDKVFTEPVTAPVWVRGEEYAHMLRPRAQEIKILGLGTSIGTPSRGVAGEILVVNNFEELKKNKDKVRGKIVVFNEDFESYKTTNVYRTTGASEASKLGAVAALVKSITPFSLYTPHTGSQTYQAGVKKIPVAAITREDAEMLYRLQNDGEVIELHIKMEDRNVGDKTTRNLIGVMNGVEKPEEIVAVTAHIDSWDKGRGVMDDGGGVILAVEALNLIKNLGLKTKRTLQTILFTAEEIGMFGAKSYVENHFEELDNYSVLLESDSGTFKPLGLDFAGDSPDAGCIIQEILKLTDSIGTTKFRRFDRVGSDITVFQDEGVPGLSLENDNQMYFWYHHSEADTLSLSDTKELDSNLALWTVASYVLSNISIPLPRNSSDWIITEEEMSTSSSEEFLYSSETSTTFSTSSEEIDMGKSIGNILTVSTALNIMLCYLSFTLYHQ